MPKEKLLISNSDLIEINENVYYFNGINMKNINTDSNIEPEDKITKIINKFTSKQYENVLILSGAGTSILKGDYLSEEFDENKHTGKTVAEITKIITEKLKKNRELYNLDKIAEMVMYQKQELNIEDLLSKISQSRDFISEKYINKFDRTTEEIENIIRELCDIYIFKDHKHQEFINKLIAKKKDHSRVKIFTTNYDTLFEQALSKEKYIVVDGFSYEFPRTFNSRYYDYDFVIRGENKVIDEPNYVDKVVHLYKIHGSIDWKQVENGDIIKKPFSNEDKSLMIYPRRAKYEQSYEIPYFDLFSRFQFELRKPRTLLIAVGFSFADKHIKSIVENSLINNAELNIIIINPTIEQENLDFFIKRAEVYNNVMLVKKTFNDFVECFQKQEAYSSDLFREE